MHPATGNPPGLKVFISYSRQDLAFADQLAKVLDWQGFHPVMDRTGVHGAENWEVRLGQLILEADIVVFVLSPDSATSDVCKWEVEEAHRRHKRIIPALCKPLGGTRAPDLLRDLNYIFFYDEESSPGSGFGSGQIKLIETLSVDIEWLREHTRLEELAARWDANRRPKDQLVRGSELIGYKNWRDRRPVDAPELTDLQRNFLVVSEESEAARENAERRQLEEMAAAQTERAQALEAAEIAQQEREKASRRVVQRTIIGLIAAVVLALTSAAAAFVAYRNGIEADTQKRLAENQRDKAREQEEIANRERIRAEKSLKETEETKTEIERQRRFFALPLISTETQWGKISEAIDIDFKFLRDEEWLRSTANLEEKQCKSVPIDKSVGTIFYPKRPPALRVTHCDTLYVTITNRSQKSVDVTVLYLDAKMRVSSFFPGGSPRIRPGSSRLIPMQIITYDWIAKKRASTGRERLIVIAAEASDSSPRTFGYIAGERLELTRGSGRKSGSLEDLLKSKVLENRAANTVDRASNKRGIEPSTPIPATTVNDAVMRSYYWDVVQPCAILGNCNVAQ